jgi:hypothetical protein
VKKFSQVTYCIAVMWIKGATISEIHKRFGAKAGKTPAAIRGLVDRLFDKRRADMTEKERADILRELRQNRQDEGLLRIEDFMMGRVANAPKVERKAAEPVKKVSKRRQKAEETKRRQQEAAEKARREEGFAPRGVMAAPLEFLYERGLLADPEEKKVGKADLITAGNSLRRYKTAERLRSTLVSAYSSGLKTQNYESPGGGGGGAGVVIHAAVVEALSNIERLQKMMAREEFDLLDRLLRMDVFVWQIPSQIGEAMVLEDLRRSIDLASVFWDMMTPDDFRKRWDRDPAGETPVDGRKLRRRSRDATEAIQKAQRKVG